MNEDWSTTLTVLISALGTILGWVGGRIKNKISNKKAGAEASATLTNYYKKELEYIASNSEKHLNKITQLEEITDKLLEQRCIRDCVERYPVPLNIKRKLLKDEFKT